VIGRFVDIGGIDD